ncbi:choline dehydrogenase [Paucibacter oligotrophus]|uniref:Choline dehydrogenase n=1 Tax=Roseateles oligotrophus TaxID=1769250 RepID=A0A840LJV2_9BURK|nr:GMC family oxidoreductase N-terminal domain-containing protein [Roseateles oligotrophus]MBB4846259.1 choline dehydrogenase [Roseateles oligotrophus]
MSQNSFDYIIVGAGTAGCVLANRLSKDPTIRVLLLEAGGRDNYLWIHIPVGYLYCIDNPRTDWCYRTQAEPRLQNRALLYPRGKVLGGSSSINGMIYMRGQAADYEGWAAQGCPGWSWQEVLPYFKRSEDHHAGPSAMHGGGNELRVERQRLSWEILDAFRQAAAQAGIPPTEDFNGGDNFGCGYFEVNQRRGVRWNAAKAFLRPALRRGNLSVLTQAEVQQLVLDEQGRCTGVIAHVKGHLQKFTAHEEVLLSSGAIGSPLTLERSGLGSARRLARLGIPVRRDLPGVGENLQDHLQLRMAFKVRGVQTLNEQVHSLLGKGLMGLRYLATRSGPLAMAPSQLGCFARSPMSPLRADLEYHVQPLSLDRFGDPLHRFPAFTASVCDLRPSSRGSVHLVSAEAGAAPQIAPNYLSTERDRQLAASALRLTRHIVSRPALAPYQPEEFLPGPQAQSPEELIAAAGRIGTTIFHPVGSCRMGPEHDELAVVTPDLRVRGVRGLRVVDASVMPCLPSGNTNAPTTMIAEKAADMILLARQQRLRGQDNAHTHGATA